MQATIYSGTSFSLTVIVTHFTNQNKQCSCGPWRAHRLICNLEATIIWETLPPFASVCKQCSKVPFVKQVPDVLVWRPWPCWLSSALLGSFHVAFSVQQRNCHIRFAWERIQKPHLTPKQPSILRAEMRLCMTGAFFRWGFISLASCPVIALLMLFMLELCRTSGSHEMKILLTDWKHAVQIGIYERRISV